MKILFLDKITSVEIGKAIEGIKVWSLESEIYYDHFPGYPMVPGVLLTESMAQLLGVLIEKSYHKKFKEEKTVYPILSIIQKAKFRSIITPGDKCLVKGKLKTLGPKRATGEGEIWVDKKKLASAELSFIIASEKNLPENKFLKKRDEYLFSLLRKM